MKGRRLSIYLVMLLSVISLVSVGFASWNITDSFTENVEGTLVADDVMNLADIVTTDITVFKYFNSCFIGEEKIKDEFGDDYTRVYPSDKGYIIITITVKDAEKLNNFKNPILDLSFDQNKTDVDSIITNGISNNGYITNISLNDVDLSEEQIKFNEHQININCAMTNDINKYVFKIEFTVNDDNRMDFFNALLYSRVNFSTFVTIGGDMNNE